MKPPSISMYRSPRVGCVAFPVRVVGDEDASEASARVAAYPWASRIIGRPQRVGPRWIFELRGGE